MSSFDLGAACFSINTVLLLLAAQMIGYTPCSQMMLRYVFSSPHMHFPKLTSFQWWHMNMLKVALTIVNVFVSYGYSKKFSAN